MVFEKAFENQYKELNLETRYRFAELEINRSTRNLLPLFQNPAGSPQEAAAKFIYLSITPNYQRNPEHQDQFLKALASHRFQNPPKEEEIRYLIIHAQSYGKIRELTKASFNTIARLRYGIPEYHPIFQGWTEEQLNQWNIIKNTFNIWNEKLIHKIEK